MPGEVEFEAHVAPLCLPTRPTFRLANFDFDSASKVVFWPHFWARIEFVCIEKPVRFLLQEQLTPLFPTNLPVRSLYFSIFFPFPLFFPLPGPFRLSLPAASCRPYPATTLIGYHKSAGVSSETHREQNVGYWCLVTQIGQTRQAQAVMLIPLCGRSIPAVCRRKQLQRPFSRDCGIRVTDHRLFHFLR